MTETQDFSNKRLEARFCGVGGQGIVLGSGILASAAIFQEGRKIFILFMNF